MPIETKDYCSEVCLEAGEPLAGTAIKVDVWLMLEYRRGWQARALDDNLLLAATNAWITQTVQSFAKSGLIARPQFIRRPQRSDTLQLFVAQGGKLTGLELRSEEELHALDLLATSLPEVSGPQYFVCTNAKRDLCCAKFGRPTYAALHAALPDRTWQTTHVGGHRYAPNVLALPQGALYGRVMAGDVGRFLEITERNQLAHEFLRGQTLYSKVAQVAKQTLIDHFTAPSGELTVDEADLKLLRWTENSATFNTPDGLFEVSVTQTADSLSLIASCGKSPELMQPLVGILKKTR